MAKRPVYYVENDRVKKKDVEFTWIAGLNITKKRENVKSLHTAVTSKTGMRVLEISSKSEDPLGVRMSAFNLCYAEGIKLESYYQASKIFSNGGPFRELAYLPSREAKKDERLKNSGEIKGFRDILSDKEWTLNEPYYDFIYLVACAYTLTKEDFDRLNEFDAFTDIEFNPKKAKNTQARAAAVLKLFCAQFGYEKLQELNKEEFVRFYNMYVSV